MLQNRATGSHGTWPGKFRALFDGEDTVKAMTRLWATLPLLAALAACSSAASDILSTNPEDAVVAGQMGQTFELRPGQTARVGTGGLLVGFRGVSQDSRCPIDVTCVWEGDAQLNLSATIERMAWTSLQVHTNVEPRSARFREYTITVLELRPAPREGQPIASGSYVATLRVE